MPVYPNYAEHYACIIYKGLDFLGRIVKPLMPFMKKSVHFASLLKTSKIRKLEHFS